MLLYYHAMSPHETYIFIAAMSPLCTRMTHAPPVEASAGIVVTDLPSTTGFNTTLGTGFRFAQLPG